MGYLRNIFRLPDYDMPGAARKDAVLLALTKIMIMTEIEETTTETEAVNTKESAKTTITIELVITTEASPRTG
jgi:hypothetical protein